MPKLNNFPYTYQFSNQEYVRLKRHLVEIYMMGFDPWPEDQDLWPKPAGAPGYIVSLYEQGSGRPFITIKFRKIVDLPNGNQGTCWRIGGSRNYECPIF